MASVNLTILCFKLFICPFSKGELCTSTFGDTEGVNVFIAGDSCFDELSQE